MQAFAKKKNFRSGKLNSEAHGCTANVSKAGSAKKRHQPMAKQKKAERVQRVEQRSILTTFCSCTHLILYKTQLIAIQINLNKTEVPCICIEFNIIIISNCMRFPLCSGVLYQE